ncbi:Poly(A) polymerase [Hanseniaspora valbyensis NRRL Y-1626]|uniref:Poly(A) polymerase n=1 Tax=Hanseniaspora valbyensis NRRL Y-1626 TaxID=766949 RepID=A0A1B7TJ94_9ASCO|nr:Poly(A) polymerase [Hanseniaspora valbyensis NRRL Y-1626]
MNQPQQWGTSRPFSLDRPTPADEALNKSLFQLLRDEKSFETHQQTEKRKKVIAVLTDLAKQFVFEASLSKGMSESLARDAGGCVYTFGSYRLGVHGPGSDIDTLIVVPKHVSREDFFTFMVPILKARPELEEIQPVSEAFVPIIKMEFDGISIDLICGKVDLAQVNSDLTLTDTGILRNIDDKDLRALNGTRVTDDILKAVPSKSVFRLALRFIKLWAQKRGIYANVFGFPGGVAWAMLVAKICQLYPNANSATIVQKFFFVYYSWKWPQPVLLKTIETHKLPFRVWNPTKSNQDRFHKMPVITPSYPSMCATHNITESNKRVILREFKRGIDICNKITTGEMTWKDLIAKHDFFHRYKFYLILLATTKGTEEEHLKWSGCVESKVRLLVTKLENTPYIDLAQPHNKYFESSYAYNTDDEAESILAKFGFFKSEPELKKYREIENIKSIFEKTEKERNGEPLTSEEKNQIVENQKQKYSGFKQVHIASMFIGFEIQEKQPIDLARACEEFMEICRSSSDFDDGDKFSIQIKYAKSYDLPSFVYDEGEQRPEKITKKRKKLKESTPNKKTKLDNGKTGSNSEDFRAPLPDINSYTNNGDAEERRSSVSNNFPSIETSKKINTEFSTSTLTPLPSTEHHNTSLNNANGSKQSLADSLQAEQ